MDMTMSDQAFEWYKKELDLKSGDQIKFHVRYGGCSTVQKGFSLGIVKENPDQPAAQIEKEGITFFVEDKEAWYFDGHDLHINFNEELNEPTFDYE
ncbi:Iron-sulfur cluster biosynthesis [Bacillus sp. THAF10]|uniref:HesB/YadR/YfhF family protein n=1 Tax=Bacillus sp. THAF10 TaxID=2587848 RepID=UPI0012681324|nr:HesB/YadR/YfhF family protein [Bacillus sp. THAF10]QFT89018.1 Iron-sulfur cluster biosynthesis [Bacillus sp. THAF10]